MRECIICRNSKDETEFDIEHIIPGSIGGEITIDSVCKLCNSKLGAKVDHYLTEHNLSIAKREELQIKSQNKVIPNSLDYHEFSLKSDKKKKLKLDKKKKSFRLVPSVKDGEAAFDINDTKNIRNYCNKHQNAKFKIVNAGNELIGHFTIDTVKFNVPLLKMAYEFAVKEIPSYFDDEKAKAISSFIYDIAYEINNNITPEKSGINISSSLLNSNLFDTNTFSQYIDSNSDNHILILISQKELGLVCYIKIFNFLYAQIQLSDKPYEIGTLALVCENTIGNSNPTTETFDSFITKKILAHPNTEKP